VSFDKEYPNRKDMREPYRKSKAIDSSCRNHGGCPYCENNRKHATERRALSADEQIAELTNPEQPK
jgi:hypothetical protein